MPETLFEIMPELLVLLSAFSLGFLGSAHCLGMCGGIITSVSLSTVSRSYPSWLLSFLFQAGRLISYSLLGFVVGGFSFWLTSHIELPEVALLLPILSSLLLVAMGLYLTRWWRGLQKLEKMGAKLWQYLRPITSTLLPIKTPQQALLLGGLWGWLPCGLVYSALGFAMLQASPPISALVMLFFGLGTLPATLSLGLAGQWIQRFRNNRWFNTGVGCVMILVGVGLLFDASLWTGDGHHNHH